MPHLLLRASQKYHLAGTATPARQNPPAEFEQFVERRKHPPPFEVIAEIDEAVALAEALPDAVMETGKALGLAVNDCNGPDAPGARQPG